MQVRFESVRPGSKQVKVFLTEGVWATYDLIEGSTRVILGREGRQTRYRWDLPEQPTWSTIGPMVEAEVNKLLAGKRLAWGPRPPRRKSVRPRDSQKAKLYRAEERVPHWGQGLMDELSDVRYYIQQLTQSRWWKSRYPDLPYVTVNLAKSRGGHAYGHKRLITLPRNAWHPMYILHEVAHVATFYRMGRTYKLHAAHGPEFCATYLELVEHCLGAEVADVLRKEMELRGVRYC